MSDQYRISPNNINTISSRQVMRIKENINEEIICWFNTKFSKLTSQQLYGRQSGELLMRSWELKVKCYWQHRMCLRLRKSWKFSMVYFLKSHRLNNYFLRTKYFQWIYWCNKCLNFDQPGWLYYFSYLKIIINRVLCCPSLSSMDIQIC